jgi:hypothetical protein
MYLSRLLLAIFFVGLVGTAAELLLLEHYEDTLQLIPFFVVAIGLGVGTWYARGASPESLKAFRGLLALLAITGLVGLFLHFRGNIEFAKETDSSLGGRQLFWEALMGATPALAPGMMVLLAAIGHAITVARAENR